MIELSQYYTQQLFSRLLVNSIDFDLPSVILDIGVGDGSLTKAALDRWVNAKFIAIDIDKKNCENLRTYSDLIIIANEDGLDPSINRKLKIKFGSVDVAICNPPYGLIVNEKLYEPIFKRANLNSCLKLKRIPSDIVFFANNISMLRQGGQLGIILPDGVLTRKDLKDLRKDIIYNHTLKFIIQLPDNIFKGTEAKTHILILSKGKSNYSHVNLMLADENGQCSNALRIDKFKLIERMDYSYHLGNSQNKERRGENLRDIGVVINRGSFTHKELKILCIDHLHTTNINNIDFESDSIPVQFQSKVTVSHDDIIMARVGKRCIGKIARIQSGEYLISDCLYRIRVPKPFLSKVWEFLNSLDGINWMNSVAHGVCSKVISKEDLLNLQLPE